MSDAGMGCRDRDADVRVCVCVARTSAETLLRLLLLCAPILRSFLVRALFLCRVFSFGRNLICQFLALVRRKDSVDLLHHLPLELHDLLVDGGHLLFLLVRELDGLLDRHSLTNNVRSNESSCKTEPTATKSEHKLIWFRGNYSTPHAPFLDPNPIACIPQKALPHRKHCSNLPTRFRPELTSPIDGPE